MDVGTIINVIRNAQNAVQTARDFIKQFEQAGATLTSTSEAEIEAEIKKLEDMLPEIRQAAQQKLRGS